MNTLFSSTASFVIRQPCGKMNDPYWTLTLNLIKAFADIARLEGKQRQRGLLVALLVLLHPILLVLLFPKLGEASNGIAFLGPVAASLLFSLRAGLLILPVNVLATALVFGQLNPPGADDPNRYLKALGSAVVIAGLCWVADRVRLVVEQRRRLTEELTQAKKMEAIGRLAGGVAHDMNNTLNAIMGSVFAHRQELAAYGRNFKDLDHIAAACDRGAQLTQTLLGFARKGKLSRQTFSLSRIAQETALVLKRTTHKDIVIRTKLPARDPWIEGDRSQLENAVMNLCLNSIDAMGAAGTLSIETGGDGNHSYLTVMDTGIGMAPEVQARAFEPFFTTKAEGKGTGLGLSMVYSTVHSMDGKIALESRPGKGTQISLSFPARAPGATGPRASMAVERGLADEPPPPSYNPDILRGLTLLLIDDEPIVLRAGVRMLRAMGCTVYSAPSGVAALDVFKERRHELSLVVVDLLMPQMDGVQTIEAIHRLDARMPVVLVSGCISDSARLALFDTKRHVATFLPKPYSAEQLCRAAEGLLTNTPTRLQSVAGPASR